MGSTSSTSRSAQLDFDVVVIGAGFSGMYALHRLRQEGLTVRVYDDAPSVGGTWWWNSYPGARVDVPGGPFYGYTFSEELVREWDWPDTHPTQEAVLAYLNHVADRFDLRSDIQLSTRVRSARFDEATTSWVVETESGETVTAQYLISAMGTLSATAAHIPQFPGIETFRGEIHHTGHWPKHEQVNFSGKRVGVVGTGSSGIQVIPFIAREADHLTVFQRTPQYSIPARTQPIDPELVRQSRNTWQQIREHMKQAPHGGPIEPLSLPSAYDHSHEERLEVFEKAWQKGGMALYYGCYREILTDPEANQYVADFIRSKIQHIVHNPEMAEKLLPNYYFGTKRPIMDEGYYEVFNRTNVTLIDLREEPIQRVTENSIDTVNAQYPVDMLVMATGYAAITGALQKLNPRGRNGVALEEKWSQGIHTYLGIGLAGFPNMFMIHGPQSPSVLFHMPFGAELQGDWIANCISYMRKNEISTIEPIQENEEIWRNEVWQLADRTLYPKTKSWYTGANIEGSSEEFLIHLGGPDFYQRLQFEEEGHYPGFVLQHEGKARGKTTTKRV